MLPLYRWLSTKLPRTFLWVIMVGIYSGLIILSIALASHESVGFIYWDQ